MATPEQRAAARRAVAALGMSPRQVVARARAWGRRGPPISLQAAYYRDLRAVLRRARDGQALSVEAIAQIVRPHGQALLRWSARKYDTPLGRALGLAPGPPRLRTDALDPDLESQLLASWTRENVALIKGASEDQIAKVSAAILRAERSGLRARDVQAEISTILAASERRARTIARDQVLKFNGQLERLKQTDAGIDGYFWRTSQDERVRPRHRGLSDQRFTWTRPPADGHPGQPVLCRCQAEPDLSGLLGDEFVTTVAPREEFVTTARME